jgi:hypothetical protein
VGVAKALAESLASRGVIVPSRLTDDELLACEVDPTEQGVPSGAAEVAAAVREGLERITTGETGPRP